MSDLEKLTTEELLGRCRMNADGRYWEEIRRRLKRLEKCEAAIRWALGEIDDFRPREEGEGAYWWRNELRERAALEGE